MTSPQRRRRPGVGAQLAARRPRQQPRRPAGRARRRSRRRRRVRDADDREDRRTGRCASRRRRPSRWHRRGSGRCREQMPRARCAGRVGGERDHQGDAASPSRRRSSCWRSAGCAGRARAATTSAASTTPRRTTLRTTGRPPWPRARRCDEGPAELLLERQEEARGQGERGEPQGRHRVERVVAAERVLADAEEREAGEAGDEQADADRDGALGERRS